MAAPSLGLRQLRRLATTLRCSNPFVQQQPVRGFAGAAPAAHGADHGHAVIPPRVRPSFDELIEAQVIEAPHLKDPEVLDYYRSRYYPQQREAQLDPGRVGDVLQFPHSLHHSEFYDRFHDWRMRLEDAFDPRLTLKSWLPLLWWTAVPVALYWINYVDAGDKEAKIAPLVQGPTHTAYSMYHPRVNKKYHEQQ